jgi:hypothetical protein
MSRPYRLGHARAARPNAAPAVLSYPSPRPVRLEYVGRRADGTSVSVVIELRPATGEEEPIPPGHVIASVRVTPAGDAGGG